METVELVNISFDWRAWKGNKCVRRVNVSFVGILSQISATIRCNMTGCTAIPEGESRGCVTTRAIDVFQCFNYVYN